MWPCRHTHECNINDMFTTTVQIEFKQLNYKKSYSNKCKLCTCLKMDAILTIVRWLCCCCISRLCAIILRIWKRGLWKVQLWTCWITGMWWWISWHWITTLRWICNRWICFLCGITSLWKLLLYYKTRRWRRIIAGRNGKCSGWRSNSIWGRDRPSGISWIHENMPCQLCVIM